MARFAVGLCLVLLLVASFSFAQSDPAAGILLFSTNNFGVDLATSNVNLAIPGRSKAGKLPFSSSFVGNSHAYFKTSTQWAVNDTFGIHIAPLVAVSGTLTGTCPNEEETDISIIDGTGAAHPVPGAAINVCSGHYSGGTWNTSDGSGYTFVGNISNGSAFVYDSSGVKNTISGTLSGHNASFTATDPDGASVSFNTTNEEWIDSLGVPALTVGSNGDYITTYSYQNGNGGTSEYSETISSTTYNILTNFNCTNIKELSTIAQPVLSLTTPNDNSQYTFSYETTPGKPGDYTNRIASITFPNSGSISYGYSDSAEHNGINCTSGVVPTITVTVSDNNGNQNKWTYVNNNSNSPSACTPGVGPCNFTVVKTDPAGNQTLYHFAGEFQTWAQFYSGGCPTSFNGCTGGGTQLRYVTTCYNGNLTTLGACQALTTPPTLPIKRTDVYTWVGMTPQALIETFYDCNTVSPCYGLVTEVKKYDYGAAIPPTGTPLSDTVIVYNSGSTCGTLDQYISTRPCSITVTGPSGQAAQTKYTYNSGGHPTQTQQWVSSSNSPLTSSAVYGGSNAAAGVLSSVTDVNQATTSYSNFVCNGMLPTTISYPLSLSASQTWDSTCAGGVLESSTDVNQNLTSYTYDDSMWRMTSATNQNYPTTNLSYPDPNHFESSMNFNGSASTVDTTTATDGLGRTILVQKRQAQGSSTYDSVQTVYGWTSGIGALSKVSMPYAAGAGGGGTIFTTTQYDALGRPSTVTDLDGGTVTYTYNGNDVLQTVASPSVQKQFEYDGMGRLTSVCEINTGIGYGTCSQTNSKSGYWTKYSYDALGDLTNVTQNAQSSTTQTRSYYYDGLGRLTKEINPESGTTQYFWDAAPSACGSGGWSTPGDLGAKVDNAQVYTCNGYDALHRLLGFLFVPSSNCSTFVYDSATPPNGVTVSNTKGRLINAYTNSACNGRTSLVADKWLGYSPRGEVTDIYSSTPNSGGYYHAAKTYWANGAVETLGGIPGVPTISYGADGEGRPSTVTGGSQNLVTATSYNPASQVTGVTLGSLDSDTYQYDPNTGRMTQYSFNVNGSSVIGKPTWNSNGTLQTLNITDPFDSANQQNCSYGYDALARISSVSCNSGTAWGQTFAYDAFGNISKSVPAGATGISWLPGYNAATNQYTLGGTSYDGDGNLKNDTFHTYQWDPQGHAIGIGSPYQSNQTFDALGNLAEQNIPSDNYTAQYLYDEHGAELGFARAQSAGWTWIPLPGGATAVYVGGNLQNYWHSDWLASARFGSTPGRGMFSDRAFAPFGEPYASAGNTSQSYAGLLQNLVPDLFETPNREYHPTQGRWITPDPGGSAAVDPTNPQTWNRYAYVLNNPLTATDPLGLFCVWDNGSFDSNDDPDTGSQAQCEGDGPNGGGTWFNGSPSDWSDSSGNQVFGSNDWSGDPNAEAAALAQGINPSVGDFGDPSGTADASASGTFISVAATTSTLPGQIPNAATPNVLPQCAPGAAGSVVYKAGVPPASPAINNFMMCVSGCMGGNPFRATSTSDSHPPGDPHSRGLAVDGTIPGTPGQIMQCGANCGALFQQNEFQNPSPNATGGHFHFQLVPGRGGALGPVTPTCHY
jgi:RHS repeat-associated protein